MYFLAEVDFSWILVLELLFILSARLVEVSIGTLRVILMNKGYKAISTILAFIEVLIWINVVSIVLEGINDNYFKVVIYSLGYALGVYFGSIIECKVALGNILIQAILPYDNGLEIVKTLRNDGLGVTTINGLGKDSEKIVLMIYARRRGKEK